MSLSASVGYISLDEVLNKVKSHILAAESHGLLCGMLCADKKTNKAHWISITLEDAELKGEDARNCLILLDKLFNITEVQLKDQEFGFELFLPLEQAQLGERAIAIGKWCQGFLLGIVQNKEFSGKGGEYPIEVQEVIRDFSEITKIDEQVENIEEEEFAFCELEEFVKVGGLLAYETL